MDRERDTSWQPSMSPPSDSGLPAEKVDSDLPSFKEFLKGKDPDVSAGSISPDPDLLSGTDVEGLGKHNVGDPHRRHVLAERGLLRLADELLQTTAHNEDVHQRIGTTADDFVPVAVYLRDKHSDWAESKLLTQWQAIAENPLALGDLIKNMERFERRQAA